MIIKIFLDFIPDYKKSENDTNYVASWRGRGFLG